MAELEFRHHKSLTPVPAKFPVGPIVRITKAEQTKRNVVTLKRQVKLPISTSFLCQYSEAVY